LLACFVLFKKEPKTVALRGYQLDAGLTGFWAKRNRFDHFA
jgi:hypothetical protein